MSRDAASALSRSPDAHRAAEELAHQAPIQEPDLLFLFATSEYRDCWEELVDAVRARFAPRAALGCTAEGVVAAGREVESGPAVSLLAVRLEGAEVETFVADFSPAGEGGTVRGVPLEAMTRRPPAGVILLADPFTFPTDALLAAVQQEVGSVPFLGGNASAGAFGGQNRLWADDVVTDRGGVGLVLRGVRVDPLVSQGCRPVGRHFVITRGRENVIESLGGKPALAALREMFRELDERDQELLGSHLHIGRVIDEYKSRFDRGDFLVRSVIGLDPESGSLELNDLIRPGQTIQFHVRDPQSASEDLEMLLRERAERFREGPPRAALLFTCNGRGTRLFSEPDHDVSAVLRHVPDAAVSGFFAAGEVGPIGGRNFLHGFTASIAFLAPA